MGTFFAPKDWGRLLTAMVTPFDESGAVNYAEAARIAAYLVDVQQNDGLVISGTTGESPTLSEVEKLKLLETVLEAVGDRAAVVFGAGTYNTHESMHLAKAGQNLGAHGIMIVNPYYSKPGQEGLYAHFAACAEATSLPVMLYNIQPRSAINLETPTLLKLAEIPNIVAVKEASGNVGQISEVAANVPAGFRVYSGDDGLTLPILSLGGHGIVSVAGHIIGDKIKAMVMSYLERDTDTALELHRSCLAGIKASFSAPNPVPVKYMLSRRGFACEDVRLPLVKLSDAQKAVCRELVPE